MGLVELSSAQDGTHAHLFLFQEALSFNKIIEWNTSPLLLLLEFVKLFSCVRGEDQKLRVKMT